MQVTSIQLSGMLRQLPRIDRNEPGARQAADLVRDLDAIARFRPMDATTNPSILQSITGIRERRRFQSILRDELVQQSASRQFSRCHAAYISFQDQHTNITRITLALVVIRIRYYVCNAQ